MAIHGSAGQPPHVRRRSATMLRADLNSAYTEVIAVRTVLAVLGIAVSSAAGAEAHSVAPQTLPASAAVTLSSPRAGARPVVLTLRMRYEMQCARPGPGPLVVTFPAGERLPSQTSVLTELSQRHVLSEGSQCVQGVLGGEPAPLQTTPTAVAFSGVARASPPTTSLVVGRSTSTTTPGE